MLIYDMSYTTRKEKYTMDECCKSHKQTVDSARTLMPDEEALADIADLFRVFGDTTRVRIICTLLRRETAVCALAEALGMSQSAISHQLRVLKQARLVKTRRDGATIYYSLNDEHIEGIFRLALEHTDEAGR